MHIGPSAKYKTFNFNYKVLGIYVITQYIRKTSTAFDSIWITNKRMIETTIIFHTKCLHSLLPKTCPSPINKLVCPHPHLQLKIHQVFLADQTTKYQVTKLSKKWTQYIISTHTYKKSCLVVLHHPPLILKNWKKSFLLYKTIPCLIFRILFIFFFPF